MKLLFIILIGLLSACAANHPYTISRMSLDELKTVDSSTLCRAYHVDRAPRVMKEIQSRSDIPESEWDSIRNRKVRIGMSELGLVCAWGFPTKINKTTTRLGVRKQWVYRYHGYQYTSANYVYTENGFVTSIQN